VPTLHDIDNACRKFLTSYGRNPDTVTMSSKYYEMLLASLPRQIIPLESGKEYRFFIPAITGGLIELVVSNDETLIHSNTTDPINYIIVVESKKVEAAFEKHVLGQP
jgi:hypothetical protein